MQSGAGLCIMDISGQSFGMDHIKTSSAEVCHPLLTSIKKPIKRCFLNTASSVYSTRKILLWNFYFNLKSLFCYNASKIPFVSIFKQTFPFSIWAQHASPFSPLLSTFSLRGEGKVASYVTKRHFTAVRRLMYEDRNGQCWNSRPHTHTQIHTNTRLMDDTSIRSRFEPHCLIGEEQL